MSGNVLHELERGTEAPGKLERAVEDVPKEEIVGAVLAQKATCGEEG